MNAKSMTGGSMGAAGATPSKIGALNRRAPAGGSLAGRGQQHNASISQDGALHAIILYGDHEELLKYNLD